MLQQAIPRPGALALCSDTEGAGGTSAIRKEDFLNFILKGGGVGGWGWGGGLFSVANGTCFSRPFHAPVLSLCARTLKEQVGTGGTSAIRKEVKKKGKRLFSVANGTCFSRPFHAPVLSLCTRTLAVWCSAPHVDQPVYSARPLFLPPSMSHNMMSTSNLASGRNLPHTGEGREPVAALREVRVDKE